MLLQQSQSTSSAEEESVDRKSLDRNEDFPTVAVPRKFELHVRWSFDLKLPGSLLKIHLQDDKSVHKEHEERAFFDSIKRHKISVP